MSGHTSVSGLTKKALQKLLIFTCNFSQKSFIVGGGAGGVLYIVTIGFAPCPDLLNLR